MGLIKKLEITTIKQAETLAWVQRNEPEITLTRFSQFSSIKFTDIVTNAGISMDVIRRLKQAGLVKYAWEQKGPFDRELHGSVFISATGEAALKEIREKLS